MLQAVEYLGKVGVGITGPEFFRGDDNKTYVVKRSNNYIGKHVLVSEIIAANFGKKLFLPFPNSNIILLDKFMDSEKSFSNIGFASEYIYNAQYATNENILQAINFKQLAGIILFDHFFQNADRTNNRKNLLIAKRESNQYLYGIDHSHLFKTGRWDKETLTKNSDQIKVYSNYIYGILLRHHLEMTDFSPYIEAFKNLSDSDIDEILNLIPYQWLDDISLKDALFQFITKRRCLIHEIVEVILNFRYIKTTYG